MKRMLKAVVTTSIVFGGVLVIAPMFVDLNTHKGKIADMFHANTGLYLAIDGDINASLLPFPRVSVHGVRVSDSETAETAIAAVEKADVSVAVLPLITGHINVKNIALDTPQINIVKYKDGSLNVALSPPSQGEDTAPVETSDAAAGEPSAPPSISIDAFTVKDGVVSYTDNQTAQSHKIEQFNTKIVAQSLLGPFDADMAFHYGGQGYKIDVQTQAVDMQEMHVDVEAMVTAMGAEIAYQGRIAFGEAIGASGALQIAVKDLPSLLAQGDDGVVKAKTVTLKTPLALEGNALTLGALILNIDGQDVAQGTGAYTLDTAKVDVSLKTDKPLALSSLLHVSDEAGDVALTLNAKGRSDKITFDGSRLNIAGQDITLGGALTMAEQMRVALDIGADRLDVPKILAMTNAVLPAGSRVDATPYQDVVVKDVKADIEYTDNAVHVKRFRVGDVAGASLSASGRVDDLASLSGIDANVSAKTKDVHALLPLVGVAAEAVPLNIKSVALDARLKGGVNALDVDADIDVNALTLGLKGIVSSLQTAPSVDSLAVRVKHQNLSDVMEMVSGAPLHDPYLQKPVNITAAVTQRGATYDIKDIKGTLSGTSLSGNMSADIGGAVPRVTADLVFGTLRLSSAVAPEPSSASKGGQKAKSAPASQGRWSRDPIDTAAFHALNADINVTADKIIYGDWPLIKPSVSATLRDGVLNVSSLKSGIYGGQLAMNAMVKTVKEARQPLSFSNNVTFTDADLGKLTTSFVGRNLLKLSGGGDVAVNLTSSGASPAALVRDLNGNVNIDGQNIALGTLDIAQFARALSIDNKAGDTVSGLWRGASSGGSTVFDTFGGNILIQNGVMNLDNIVMDGASAKVTTKGAVNLPQWTIASTHSIFAKEGGEVPEAIPPFEVKFNGSLDNPSQTFAQDVLQGYLRSKLDRKLKKVVSEKLNKYTGGSESESPQNLEDVAGDVLEGVLGDLFR